jgi:hypothetical protein
MDESNSILGTAQKYSNTAIQNETEDTQSISGFNQSSVDASRIMPKSVTRWGTSKL